jgi:hypothetical protein
MKHQTQNGRRQKKNIIRRTTDKIDETTRSSETHSLSISLNSHKHERSNESGKRESGHIGEHQSRRKRARNAKVARVIITKATIAGRSPNVSIKPVARESISGALIAAP